MWLSAVFLFFEILQEYYGASCIDNAKNESEKTMQIINSDVCTMHITA